MMRRVAVPYMSRIAIVARRGPSYDAGVAALHQEQRERAHTYLKASGVTGALFASPLSVAWLTGFAPPVQLGPDPFAGGPTLVWYEDGQFVLIVLDSYAADAAVSGCPVVTYRGYTIEGPVAGAGQLATALRTVVETVGVRGGTLGVEEYDLPISLWTSLRTALPAGIGLMAIDGWLEPHRAIKTDEELAKLRANFALTDLGHAVAGRAAQQGQREIDVWVAIESAIQQAAGQRLPIGNDCVVGYRQENIGGWPLGLQLRPHDALIVDLSTRLYGYWSDSCATYYAGEPTQRQMALHRAVAAALEFAISLIKPGAIAGEIDRSVRQFIANGGYPVYNHHTGHGVGVSGHEAPRIVPGNDQAIEQGMVIMLEPGIYIPGETAVRLEHAVVVTATGTEILTHHDMSLP